MKMIIALFAAMLPLLASAQQLPQFTYLNFDGWEYNNPNVPLTSDNISSYRITIYVNSQGRILTLSSPVFSCQDIDSIHADVLWKSRSIDIPLTMALDDGEGNPLDSVSRYPATASTANQVLAYTLPIPHGLTSARLRFFSLQANVNNGGVIRQVLLTGIAASSPPEVTPGDVDGDGIININDVTTLINCLLTDAPDIDQDKADVNRDGRISIDDVTALIEILLNS